MVTFAPKSQDIQCVSGPKARVAFSIVIKSLTLATDSDSACTEGVDDLNPLEISLIVGDNNAVIRLSDGSHDRVQRTTRAARCPSFCHHLSPHESCLFVKWKNSTSEE